MFNLITQYLSGGPGGIGGAYIHPKHKDKKFVNLKGWYSNKDATRFDMLKTCDRATGIEAFRMSTPSVFLISFMLTSLKVSPKKFVLSEI